MISGNFWVVFNRGIVQKISSTNVFFYVDILIWIMEILKSYHWTIFWENFQEKTTQ